MSGRRGRRTARSQKNQTVGLAQESPQVTLSSNLNPHILNTSNSQPINSSTIAPIIENVSQPVHLSETAQKYAQLLGEIPPIEKNKPIEEFISTPPLKPIVPYIPVEEVTSAFHIIPETPKNAHSNNNNNYNAFSRSSPPEIPPVSNAFTQSSISRVSAALPSTPKDMVVMGFEDLDSDSDSGSEEEEEEEESPNSTPKASQSTKESEPRVGEKRKRDEEEEQPQQPPPTGNPAENLTQEDILKIGMLKLISFGETVPYLRGVTKRCAEDKYWNLSFEACKAKWKKKYLNQMEPEYMLGFLTGVIALDIVQKNYFNKNPVKDTEEETEK